jgi:organic radical activating enzyme
VAETARDAQVAAAAGKLARRIDEESRYQPTSVTPPFPRSILFEVSNLCNHACVFCAYPKMTRPGRRMDLALAQRLLREAYDLGAREAGFYSGAEPFTSPDLEAIVRCAKQLGYEYTFISTNGSLATEPRLRALIDAGLDSIKFSINGADRETYRRIHGQDHFDRVLRHVRFADEYRRATDATLYLSVSFVAMDRDGFATSSGRDALEALVRPWVDEVLFWDATSENGQMIGLGPSGVSAPCGLPFMRAHVSAEGHLRMCCNDYQNYLSLVDLRGTTLADGWQAEIFRDMRRRHLDNRLEGTLCFNCVNNVNTPIAPIVPSLATPVDATFFTYRPPAREAGAEPKER